MSTPDIEKTLNKYYKNISQNEDGIFRCERYVKGKRLPYQVFYFDNTEKLNYIGDNNSLSDYVRKKLISPYFTNSGSIQWNYYYTFLVDDDKISKKERPYVLTNNEFARKFIVERSNLNEWLRLEYNFDERTDKKVETQLTSVWQNEFEKRKYPFIFYKDTRPEDGFTHIYLGTTPPVADIIKDAEVEEPKDNWKLGVIDEIQFDDYRTFPKGPNYKFKKVNLIYGPNGFGKTSLLQAIEAFFCGYNLHPDELPQKKGIKMKIAGEIDFQTYENSTKKSTIHWRNKFYYESIKARMPEKDLAENFSRFNFYDSDAGFQLSQTSSQEITETFEKVILGATFKQIDERVKAYGEVLRKGLKRYTDTYNDKKAQSEETVRAYEQLKEVAAKDNEALFEQISGKITGISWKTIPEFSEKDTSKIELLISSAVNDISNILPVLLEIGGKSLQEIRIAALDIEKLATSYDDCKRKLIVTEGETVTQNKTYSHRVEQAGYFKKYLLYLSLKAREKLIGNGKEEERLISEISKLNWVRERFTDEVVSMFSPIKMSGNDFLEKVNLQLSNNDRNIREFRKAFDEKKLALNSIEQALGELKRIGKSYLHNAPSTDICPLCNHKHDSFDKLIAQVEKNTNNLNPSLEISGLKNNIDKCEHEIILEQKQKKLLSQLEACYLALFGEDSEASENLDHIVELIAGKLDRLDALNINLKKIIAVREVFNKEQLSEQDFIDIEIKLEYTHPGLSEMPVLKIQQIVDQMDIKVSETAKVLRTLKERKNDLENELSKIMSKINAKLSIEQFEKWLRGKQQVFITVEGHMKNILSKMNIKLDDNLIDIQQSIIGANILLSTFRTQKEEREKTSMVLQEKQAKIINDKADAGKMEEGIGRLRAFDGHYKSVLEAHNKDKYLEDFFKSNERELMEIYRQIHTPKEFSKIQFNKVAGVIQLFRDDLNDWENITHISSGQRTALALSIFLTFNRQLKDGPPLLLFDDPVALVDDINTLTFFDYLRENINKTNRQLFFATANEGLAFLFKQKFDYLGDDFNFIPLTRQVD